MGYGMIEFTGLFFILFFSIMAGIGLVEGLR
jgi:hypothetical protein